MKGIYVNWRVARDPEVLQSEFCDFNLLTMLLSVLKFKSFGNSTKFYADDYTVRYLDRAELLGAWDEYDCTTLGKDIKKNEIDPSVFFSMGKFFSLLHETAPVMLVDIDLVIWQDPRLLIRDKRVAFTHWESVNPSTKWYCRKRDLSVPPGYCFNQAWDFRLPAANTSTLCFSDTEIKDYYAEQAIRFMKNNPAKKAGKQFYPEPYFAEQRLLPMCVKERGLMGETVPLIDTVWSPVKGMFTKKDEAIGWWYFFIPDPGQRITHTWISKAHIAGNTGYRDYFCCKMIEEILRLCPMYENTLRKIQGMERYFDLLEQYGDVENMIRKHAVSDKLYQHRSLR